MRAGVRSGRERFWLLAALAGCSGIVLVGVFLALGSHRQSGKLLVEAGPDVEVVVAGEGVVHRQTGPGDVPLPAGRYEVWCSANNRIGPSLWVDVPTGGEAEAQPATPGPAGPFVILAREDESEREFDTLEGAAAATRTGDVIEI